MSSEFEQISNEALDQRDVNSVFDFLYHDARRVGSFLAQLDPHGHLQSLKTVSQAGESKSRKSTMRGTVGAPSAAAVGGDRENLAAEQMSESSDRTYDPLWTNAIVLLEQLEDHGLVNENIHEAGLGEFVLLKGVLKFFDLRLVQNVLSTDAMKRKILKDGANQKPNERNERILGMEIMKTFPHTLQGHFVELRNDEFHSGSWLTFRDEGMVVSPTDIVMKYGTMVNGLWSMLAIKDAYPDDGPEVDEELTALLAQDWDAAAADRNSTPFALLAETIAPLARKVMGRPGLYYGITPIMMFRETKRKVST